jgi:UDP:flavonoid glycosyltransferase YjiC (YdhE family)
VTPFAGDQPFWAERLRRAGVGAPPAPAADLNARALGQAIAIAETREIRARAAALGERMRAENGVASAVLAIEAIMASR